MNYRCYNFTHSKKAFFYAEHSKVVVQREYPIGFDDQPVSGLLVCKGSIFLLQYTRILSFIPSTIN